MITLFNPSDANAGANSLLSDEEIKERRRQARAAAAAAGKQRPMTHWAQALAQGLEGAVAGYELGQVDKAQKASNEALAKALEQYGGGSTASTAPASATSGSGSVPSMVAANDAYPPSLIGSESGGNWSAQNNAVGAGGAVGHFGRLQFGQARLAEAANAGAIPQGTTPQAFMASPEMQKAAERWHFADIDQNIQANGLDKAIGRTIGGVPVTLDGMRAVAHLGGNRGLQRFIETGGQYNPSDRNGTSLLDYLRRHGNSRTQTAAADLPAPGASPVEAATGQPGFAIPPAPDALPIMQPGGALPNFDPATGRWLGPSNPPALAATPPPPEQPEAALPQVAEAPAPAPEAAAPQLARTFTDQGVAAPWMGTALAPDAPVPQPQPQAPQTVQAPMPPPRPADLALNPQADLPAPGAVPAIGQLPVSPATGMPDLSNSNDAGARVQQVMAEQSRQGQPATDMPLPQRIGALLGGNDPITAPAGPTPQALGAALSASGGQPAPGGLTPQMRLGLALLRSGNREAGIALVNEAMKPEQFTFAQMPDGTILRQGSRSGSVAPVYKADAKPTYGVIGKDEFGNERYGWIDPGKRTTTPGESVAAAPNASPSTIPPVPAGVDPKIWRSEQSKQKATEATTGNFDTESKLRGEFSGRLKEFGAVQDAFGRVVAAVSGRASDPNAKSPAADIALVFGYMKMLDPGSVVREGEYATAQNAAGIPERIRNYYNKAIDGEFLSDSQRNDMVTNAGRLYDRAYSGAEAEGKRYRDLATGYGLNADRVVALPNRIEAPKLTTAPKPGQPAPSAAPAAKAPVKVTSPEEAMKLPKGTPIILPDGSPGVVP